MGMFDWVEVHQDIGINILSDRTGVKALQTKTLDCTMATYRLHDDQLFRVQRRLRRTGGTRYNPIFKTEEPVIEQIGEREIPVNFHGELVCIGDTDKEKYSDIILKFTDGKLIEAVDKGRWKPPKVNEEVDDGDDLDEEDPEEWWEG